MTSQEQRLGGRAAADGIPPKVTRHTWPATWNSPGTAVKSGARGKQLSTLQMRRPGSRRKDVGKAARQTGFEACPDHIPAERVSPPGASVASRVRRGSNRT